MTIKMPHLTLLVHLLGVILSSFTDEKAASERPHGYSLGELGFKCSTFPKFGYMSLPCASCPELGGGETRLLSCQVFMSSYSL